MQDHETRRGRIELTLGNASFAGEGDQDWLDQQVDKFIDTIGHVQIDSSSSGASSESEGKQKKPVGTESLASFLKAKGGDTIQVQRFLATAGWLCLRGENVLTTKIVSKALQDNHQKKLSNPSDCLHQNISKGFCERDTQGFFITPEGWKQLGENGVQ